MLFFRKLFFSLAAMLFAGILTGSSMPAFPRPIVHTQSDGTQITIRIVGDEHQHYVLSSEGYTLVRGSDKDYYYATLSTAGRLVPTTVKALPLAKLKPAERAKVLTFRKGLSQLATGRRRNYNAPHSQAPISRADGKVTAPDRISTYATKGKLKSLVILVEYQDISFTTSNVQGTFHNLLMQKGYSDHGATGSAWDYYNDNSNGQFDPDFVVVGPYRVSRKSAYYAKEDARGGDNTPEMIVEACRLADGDVDFSQFANDGVVRDVFVFFAGVNQAETDDKTTIWPHRWEVTGDPRYNSVFLDGNQLLGYACSSELNHAGEMAGIGTFCHEFGHVLGWPDFYDTDYDGSGGEAPALENYSLMCGGGYNNDGRTPPAVNILERWMVGWAEPTEITEACACTLDPVWKDQGYLVRTGTDNDYFLMESRATGGFKWDNYIGEGNYGINSVGKGLLVYHVDYTTRYASLWTYDNTLNANPSHECMKLVRSVPKSSSEGKQFRTYFPGSSNVTQLSLSSNKDYVSWKGSSPLFSFTNISLQGERITMTTETIYKISIQANQVDALLTWDNSSSPTWQITWKVKGTNALIGDKTVSGPTFQLEKLTPATTYELAITPLAGASANTSMTFTFTTNGEQESGAFRLNLSGTTYSSNEPIALSFSNYGGTVKSATWYVDGNLTTDTAVRLIAGEHRIRLVLSDVDGSTLYITKYITVK